MLSSYFITSFRNLLKRKSHTLINIGGLTLGITFAILIYLITTHELGFDRYHPDLNNIYRIVSHENEYGSMKYTAGVPYLLPRFLADDFSEIEYTVLTDAMGSPTVKIGTGIDAKLYKENRGYAFVSQYYFKLFKYKWIRGNHEEALKNENSVVISRSLALKYFGDVDPVGQTMELTSFGTTYLLTVTGLVEDVAANSDLPFNLLIHYNGEGENKRGWDNWHSTSGMVHCYLKLKPETKVEDIENKLAPYLTRYRNDEEAENTVLKLQPLKALHYDKRFGAYGGKVISKSSLTAMAVIGWFILLTACINFINLNTVLVARRGKEVGIRKILGVRKSNLIWHFLIETAILTLISMLVAFVLVEILLLNFNHTFGYSLSFSPLEDIKLLIFIITVFLVVSLISGLHPALTLAKFNPLAALKSARQPSFGKGISLRRVLITLQLIISQTLVICVLIVSNQTQYFRNAPLGFDKISVLELKVPDTRQVTVLNQHFSTIPQIQQFCFSNTGAKSDDAWGGDFSYSNRQEIIKQFAEVKFIDTSYLSTYKIALLAGKDMIIPYGDSTHIYLVNSTFVKAMGLKSVHDAIGEEVTYWGKKGTIRGVVSDFNTTSFHGQIKPLIMTYDTEDFNLAALRIQGPITNDLIVKLEKIWKTCFPDQVFEYEFLDDKIQRLYQREEKISKMFVIATIIAIIIGCFGLFGLISFITTLRSKEMGIRKILGASSGAILFIFSMEFVWLILVAFIIAFPVSWYFMDDWLQNFAYKIKLTPWLFIVGLLITIFITFATVIYKSAVFAITNPIDALKDE